MLCKTINNQSHKTIRVTNIRITNNQSHKTIRVTNNQSHKTIRVTNNQPYKTISILLKIILCKTINQGTDRGKYHPKRSTSMTEIQSLIVDQLLQYLIAVNGHGNIQIPNASPETPSSPRSESTPTTSTYNSEEDSSSSDDESMASTMSDRQLRPQVPISYNETVLKKLHGQPQVRMCNNLSIQLPTDSSKEDTDSESEETERRSKYVQ